MKELDGAELASFWSRAAALTIDFVLAGAGAITILRSS
jgi:hypothetical protein